MSQSFSARVEQRLAKVSQGASEDLWRYREAASILVFFDYESLQPLGEVSPSSNAKTELLADCDVEYLSGGTPRWSLRTPIRQAALHRLMEKQSVEAALAANSRPETLAQKLLERLLKNYQDSARVVRARAAFGSPEENQALLQVIDWLSGVPEFEGKLPLVEEVKQRIAGEHLVEPFRQLVGANFAGRTKELHDLANYVGVHDAYSAGESAFRVVERILSLKDRPPLFIHGPGGSGKSTLIAKFILQHATVEQSSRFPYAYLDFDRAGLLAEEPITLLFDIMRQLAIQFPAVNERYLALADEWSARLSQQTSGSEEQGDAPTNLKSLRLSNREPFISEFANFVKSLQAKDQPLLLVLDTFEEIQFRSTAYTDQILNFLEELQKQVPRLRTVLSGRDDIQPKNYSLQRMTIGNFDNDAAVSYLAGRGLTDARVAQVIFNQVGGSPLVLRLAADVAKLDNVDEKGIADLDSGWLSYFHKKSIPAVLYKRILSHVYNGRVEKLAYPGLVLRVITPNVLLEVLGPACEVSIASLDDAKELVKLMKARLSTILVPASGEDEVLIHRPDMRSILLSDLKTTAETDTGIATKLTSIHINAIDYYYKFSDPAHRAEEIYHRLALRIDRKVLKERWMDGLTPFLGSSIRELPPAGQVYLAARLKLELPDELWRAAEDEDWILYASRLVDQMLALQKPFDALGVLRQRPHLWLSDGLIDVYTKVVTSVFNDYARQYEELRESQPAGGSRTGLLNSLVAEMSNTARDLSLAPSYAQQFFSEGGPGKRIVAIAIAGAHPVPEHMDLAIAAIRNALSPFEQFHALRLARKLFDQVSSAQRDALFDALQSQEGIPIHESDPSRFLIKKELLERFSQITERTLAAVVEEKDPEGWDNDGAWAQLLYAIWDKSCTPFLGTGACADVLPLGTTIAQRWAEEFDYPFSDSSNLPRVAQFVGIMKSGPFLPRLKIKAEFQDKVPDHTNPDEPHRVLGGFNLPVYITTNYDSFMFNELKRQGKNATQQCCEWHKAKDLSKTRGGGATALDPTPESPVVYHLHGYLADPMSMVLTEDDYLNFLINISEENVIPSHVEAAFGTDRAFLFIGYSLEDMSFKVLFRKFGRKMASSPGDRHIAVQLHTGEGLTEEQKRKQREFLEKLFGTQNVKIYWGEATKFLRSLRRRWEKFTP